MDPATRQTLITLFQKEVEMLARIRHTGVPGIVDFFVHQHNYCLVMELIEGENLLDILEARLKAKQPFTVTEVIELIVKVCEVVEHLHAQSPAILYRDMKPANVMRRPDGTLVLVDFGLAGFIRLHGQGNPTEPFGSPGYAPPEQYAPGVPSDVRTDVYGIAATAWHLLSGDDPAKHPMMYDPFSQFRTDVPDAISDVIFRGLASRMEDRFDSVHDFREALIVASGMPTGSFQAVKAITAKPSVFVPDQALSTILTQLCLPASATYGIWGFVTECWFDPWHTLFHPFAGYDRTRREHEEALVRLKGYCQQGLLTEAFDEGVLLTRGMERSPRREEHDLRDTFNFILAKLYEAKGQYRRAIYHMDRSLRENPQRQVTYAELARLKRQEQYVRQQEQLRRKRRLRNFLLFWVRPTKFLGRILMGGGHALKQWLMDPQTWQDAESVLWGDRWQRFDIAVAIGCLLGFICHSWRAGFDGPGFGGTLLVVLALWIGTACLRVFIHKLRWGQIDNLNEHLLATFIFTVIGLFLWNGNTDPFFFEEDKLLSDRTKEIMEIGQVKIEMSSIEQRKRFKEALIEYRKRVAERKRQEEDAKKSQTASPSGSPEASASPATPSSPPSQPPAASPSTGASANPTSSPAGPSPQPTMTSSRSPAPSPAASPASSPSPRASPSSSASPDEAGGYP